MRVYLAGGIHEDPLCRPRLVDWLKHLVGHEGQPPRLIAVEQDPNVKATLTMERGRFKSLASGLWGDALDSAVGDALCRTLGWEVDAHREVIDEEPFFLDDQGTRAHAVEAGLHLTVTKMRLAGYTGDRTNVTAIANYIDQAAIGAASTERYDKAPDFRNEQAVREAGWSNKIRRELARDLRDQRDGWIIAVVGALHASRYDDRTFRKLLANTEGLQIADVNYLAWTPPGIG